MLKKLNRINAGIRQERPVKVLQFGDGNFLRGFADWIIDILNEQTDFNGGIQVISPLRRSSAAAQYDQDGLYHVVLNGIKRGTTFSELRMITAVSGYVDPYGQYEAFLALAGHASIKFVISNTTEAGISFNPGDTDADKVSESFPGKVTQLLYHRYKRFDGDRGKGLIFLPCELIENNGLALKLTVLQYAQLWKLPLEFIHWIDHSNIFCNTLVDRIVTGFPKATADEINRKTGFADNRIVAAEPYYLWVIEGPSEVRKNFPVQQAGLEVLFVNDLTPYRTRKVRILNGAHTSLMAVAYLKGFRTVLEAVQDPELYNFIQKAITSEIIPTLPLHEKELIAFAAEVLERFQNPTIRHELSAIALNSITKFKVRVLPSILDYVSLKGKLPPHLVYAFASLLVFYRGDWKGEKLPLNDNPDTIDFFKQSWAIENVAEVVHTILSNTRLWDQDLTSIEGLVEAVVREIGNWKIEI